jgi:retinol dehydrogenase-14
VNTLPLAKKVVLITGGNSGVGRETAAGLAAMGATTVLACRDIGRAEEAAADLRDRIGNSHVTTVRADLRDLETVDSCASEVLDRFSRVDILVNNAGGYWDVRETTAQGFEQHFGVNYLSHYLLTRRLLKAQGRLAPNRIVNVTSVGHRAVKGIDWDDLQLTRGWTVARAYGQSKLAQILFTRELARRFGEAGIVAHAAHPGSVKSNFGADGDTHGMNRFVVQAIIRLFGVSPASAARTSIHLASSEQAGLTNGGYWVRGRQHRASRAGRDDAAAARLWDVSEGLLNDVGMSP